MRRALALPVLAALLAPAFVAADAAEVLFFELEVEEATLRGHVHLAPPEKRPAPVILVMSPYWNTADLVGADTVVEHALDPLWFLNSTETDPRHAFVLANYSLAMVNVRGTGLSSGCLMFGGDLEAEDAAAVVGELGKAAWGDGQVAMMGHSYPGWTQYMAAVEAPPALKAIAPASSIVDLWQLMTRNGAPAFYAPVVVPVWDLATSGLGAGETPPCDPEGTVLSSLENTGDAPGKWYQERDLRGKLAHVRVPMFLANGMLPYGVPGGGEGHVLQFEGMWGHTAGPQHFLLGRWKHDWPGAAYPEYEADMEAFLAHHLRGGPPPAYAVKYQDTHGAWNLSSSWPPPGTTLALNLTHGTLAPSATAPGTGACEQPLGKRFTNLSALDLAGNFQVELNVTAGPGNATIAAYLYDVASGAPACHPADEVTRALGSLAHLHGGALPQGPFQVTLPSYPFAHRVAPERDLVLALGTHGLELLPNHEPATITVHDARLVLPVKA